MKVIVNTPKILHIKNTPWWIPMAWLIMGGLILTDAWLRPENSVFIKIDWRGILILIGLMFWILGQATDLRFHRDRETASLVRTSHFGTWSRKFPMKDVAGVDVMKGSGSASQQQLVLLLQNGSVFERLPIGSAPPDDNNIWTVSNVINTWLSEHSVET